MRARIAEGEPADMALEKLQAAIAENVDDPEERSWLEPRLAHLLGLTERTAPDRDDLFSAWRLFFERLSATAPTVLVFEDLQWADTALTEFIEYLLEWSRAHPLFVVTLARLEIADKHPTWGAQGSATSPRCFSSRFPPPPWTSSSRGSFPVWPASSAARSATAQKASRSTPSRRSACCSTAGSSSATATGTGPPARSTRSRFPRRCTR
jgi:hypothetical protein